MAAASAATDTIAGLAPRPTLVPVPALRYWRTRRALPQTRLAELIGVAVSTVQRLEAGGEARLATVAKLAGALNVDPAALQDPPPTS